MPITANPAKAGGAKLWGLNLVRKFLCIGHDSPAAEGKSFYLRLNPLTAGFKLGGAKTGLTIILKLLFRFIPKTQYNLQYGLFK